MSAVQNVKAAYSNAGRAWHHRYRASAGNSGWKRCTAAGALAITLACIYVISWPILYASDRLIARIGQSKVGIITRVLGIILAALAVQYVFNGITGYYDSLINR